MFEHKKLGQLNDYFKKLEERPEKGIYFYRFISYSPEVEQFLMSYYRIARREGIVLEEKIPNPDEKNLSYYEEMMGMEFQLSMGFLTAGLQRWLPRLNGYQRDTIAASIYDVLNEMKRSGKNENMLKNAYIKFMCWMYYRFERILGMLGENQVPKILYQGSISRYELDMLCILARAGCDVVLLAYDGDAGYLRLDAQSGESILYDRAQGDFPPGFSLSALRERMREEEERARIYGEEPSVMPCTNAWMSGRGIEDILRTPALRGGEQGFFYNAFLVIHGVWDKLTYVNDLYQMHKQFELEKRSFVAVNGRIEPPTPDELAEIERKNYQTVAELVMNLSGAFAFLTDPERRKLVKKAWMDIIFEMEKEDGMNLNRLSGKAIYLLCWMKRYSRELFARQQGCFCLFGGCNNENEAWFLRMLSGLPVDVLVLIPGCNEGYRLQAPNLHEIHHTESLPLERFPQQLDVAMGTAAYHAERELDEIMYQDSGIYRNRQFGRANSITLKTMYEEIAILWDQELKYRPNFSITGDVVNLPVLFAKVCGVKDEVQDYWNAIRQLNTPETYVPKHIPMLQPTDENPFRQYATQFWKHGRLQKEVIKNHKDYAYGHLREDVQEYMLEKLQLLIDEKLIRGTGQNGMEYNIIAVVLNLDRDLVRLIQNFDFTKKNPKLIYVHTTEEAVTVEDAILLAYLNLLGFDIAIFVPTGYQVVEKYYNKIGMEEHQIGNYHYDLQVPNLDSSNIRPSWRKKFFKRGN